MSVTDRGTAAEAAVLMALASRGVAVLVPFGRSLPYDLVWHVPNGGFVRIQCKRGWARGGCILFNSCATDHGRGRQDYRGVADLFGVWFQPRDQVYLVPVQDAATRTTRLRIEPARNSQAKGNPPRGRLQARLVVRRIAESRRTSLT